MSRSSVSCAGGLELRWEHLAMRRVLAVQQTECPTPSPALDPERHDGAVARGEPGHGGRVVGRADMRVDAAEPRRGTAALDRGAAIGGEGIDDRCGEGAGAVDVYRIAGQATGEAADPLLPRGDALIPQRDEHVTGSRGDDPHGETLLAAEDGRDEENG